MSRCGKSNYERFPIICRDGVYYCRMCETELTGQKTSFCGPDCLDEFFMKTDWQKVRKVIYDRDGGVCQKCGKEVPLWDYHVDHIIPISKGGDEWELTNLELSCPTCNLKKGAKLVLDDQFSLMGVQNA